VKVTLTNQLLGATFHLGRPEDVEYPCTFEKPYFVAGMVECGQRPK